MEDVGSAVRRKRKALGYTLEQMSNVTHISKRTLIKLEAGEDVRYSTLLVALSAVGLALSFNATSLEDLEAIENGTFELDDGAFWV